MNVADMIVSLREDKTHTNINQLSDTKALRLINLAKDNFHPYIVTYSGENMNWDIWTDELTSDKYEYLFPTAASDTAGNMKIDSLSISYDGEIDDLWRLVYYKAKLVDRGSFQRHWNYYLENQPKNKPIYFISDKSVFIAPMPISTISSWIELTGVKTIPNYDSNTNEAGTKIPYYFHDALLDFAAARYFQSKRQIDDANYFTGEYDRKKKEVAQMFDDRNQWPFYARYPKQEEDDEYFSTSDMN